MGIVFAILSALGWGVSAIFVGKGLQSIKVLPGTAFSIISSFFTVALVTSVLQWRELTSISWQGVLLFAGIGVLSFALGRLLNYMGIQRIGAARATSLAASAPFFAGVSAVIFLKETPNLLVISGTALVIGGLYLTMSGKR